MWKIVKDIILSVLINAGILYFVSSNKFGLVIESKADIFQVFLLLGLVFWIVNFGIKRILHIITFPLKFLTLGISSIVINVGVFYFFQWFINENCSQFARVQLPSGDLGWVRVLILSVIISTVYALLSKILK
ncbi:hypothetical protein BSK20_02145 [SR1 bacterium human oral taxon HOT-345]|jgi:hypothetical protein|nr:hypothetical protein BSK20_02145 [SR1 bacterium human oral taxon HOT-345]